jgi:hypothetical protein
MNPDAHMTPDQATLRLGAGVCRARGWQGGFRCVLMAFWLGCFGAALCAEDTNAPTFPVVKLGEWTPIFQGVEHLGGQMVAGAYGNQVIHALRVDLLDPDMQFFTTPLSTNAQSLGGETIGQTTSDFLRSYNLQVAINANFFGPIGGVPEAPAMVVLGLAISRGAVVSPAEDAIYSATLTLTSNNVPSIVATNWPPMEVGGIYTAVTGNRPLVLQGVNVGQDGPVNPRTAIGYTQDKRYLLLLTIDGRQYGYSDGATDFDTAQWMLRLGAFDAINLDGGGSTAMAIADGRGGAIALNQAIDSHIPGHERICANHFGINARPLAASVVGATNVVSSVGIAAYAPEWFRLSVRGSAGDIYRIEFTDSLSDANWQTLTTSPVGEPGWFDHIDTAATGTRFYRAVKLTDAGAFIPRP